LVGGCGIGEALCAGAEQVIVVTAVPEKPAVPPRRRGPRAKIDGVLAALERQAVDRDVENTLRINRLGETLGHPTDGGGPARQDPAPGLPLRGGGVLRGGPGRGADGPSGARGRTRPRPRCRALARRPARAGLPRRLPPVRRPRRGGRSRPPPRERRPGRRGRRAVVPPWRPALEPRVRFAQRDDPHRRLRRPRHLLLGPPRPRPRGLPALPPCPPDCAPDLARSTSPPVRAARRHGRREHGGGGREHVRRTALPPRLRPRGDVALLRADGPALGADPPRLLSRRRVVRGRLPP